MFFVLATLLNQIADAYVTVDLSLILSDVSSSGTTNVNWWSYQIGALSAQFSGSWNALRNIYTTFDGIPLYPGSIISTANGGIGEVTIDFPSMNVVGNATVLYITAFSVWGYPGSTTAFIDAWSIGNSGVTPDFTMRFIGGYNYRDYNQNVNTVNTITDSRTITVLSSVMSNAEKRMDRAQFYLKTLQPASRASASETMEPKIFLV